MGPVHILIDILSIGLILCLLVQAILSWFAAMIPPTHPVVRFFTNITSPVLDPIRRLLPSMSVGVFDLSGTVAFLLAWWGIQLISTLLGLALPASW